MICEMKRLQRNMQQALAATAKEKAPEQVPANKHDNNKKRKKQQNKPYSFFPSPFVLLRSCRQTYSRILRCIANDEARCFVIFYFRHKAYEYKSQVGMSSYVGPM
ncbi:hypothetical protein QL285_033882 [Trifolium repens]|nr:hypothetical protein QL285_033882 [Trifolium repens]